MDRKKRVLVSTVVSLPSFWERKLVAYAWVYIEAKFLAPFGSDAYRDTVHLHHRFLGWLTVEMHGVSFDVTPGKSQNWFYIEVYTRYPLFFLSIDDVLQCIYNTYLLVKKYFYLPFVVLIYHIFLFFYWSTWSIKLEEFVVMLLPFT